MQYIIVYNYVASLRYIHLFVYTNIICKCTFFCLYLYRYLSIYKTCHFVIVL